MRYPFCSITRWFFLVCFFCLNAFDLLAQEVERGQLFVAFDVEEQVHFSSATTTPPANLSRIIRNLDVTSIAPAFRMDHPKLRNIHLVKYDADQSPNSAAALFENLEFVTYAEPVPLYRTSYIPNDLNAAQGNLQAIEAPLAWDIQQGTGNVLVAIVDDAVLTGHSDLAGAIWTNPNEIPGDNIDNDGNGYIDDVTGWDAADNDNNPNPPASASNTNFTHGTHVAGIAGAVTDNNNGIASIGFNVQLMAVKTKASATMGSSLQAPYQGVEYAIASGADVINMSWGGATYSITYQTLMNIAFVDSSIVLVAAAGNSSTAAPFYPAAYNNVVSVGATDNADNVASFTNYGSTIDVMAPGVNVYSTLAGGNSAYGLMSGTSMASPLVAGLASLLISQNSLADPQQVVDCIVNTADNIDAQNPNFAGQMGSGRINAFEAVKCLKPINAQFTCSPAFVCPGNVVQFTDESTNSPLTWEWTFPGGTPATSNLQNPSITYNTPGFYDVTLIVTNANGSDTLTIPNHIEVATPTAVISGSPTIISGNNAWLLVHFTGSPPFSFTYTDGTNTTTISGITSSPYQLQVSPTQTTTYTLTAMNDAGCAGTVSGSAVVTVTNLNGCGVTSHYNAIYGGVNDERGYGIIATSDGGALITGRTTSFGAGGSDLYAIKTDACGTILWENTYGGTSTDAGYAVTSTMDGGYCFASQGTFNGSLQFYLTKTDANGVQQWSRSYGGGGMDGPRKIIQDANGDFMVMGFTNSFGAGGTDFMLLKTDANGNTIWSKTYGNNNNDFSYDFAATPAGGYILAGYRRDYFAGSREGYLIEIDAAGNVIWANTYSASAFDYAESVYPLENNTGYLVASNTNSSGVGGQDITVQRLDLLGNITWSYTYGTTGDDYANEILPAPGGNFYIIGAADNGSNSADVYLMTIDSLGNQLTGSFYGGNANEFVPNTSPASALTTTGNVLITGWTNSFGSNEQLFVAKTDTNGFFTCDFTNQLLTRNTFNVSVVSNTPSVSNPTNNANVIVDAVNTPQTIVDVSCLESSGCNQTLFNKIIGSTGLEQAHTLVESSDGGMLLVATTDGSGAGGKDLLLVRTDADGNIIWTNTYGGTGNEDASNFHALQMPDSGFVIGGGTSSFGTVGQQSWIIRIDVNGNIVWEKRLDRNTNETNGIRGVSLSADSLHILVCGTENQVPGGFGSSDLFVAKLDLNGNQIWGNYYGANSNDHAIEVVEGANGNYLASLQINAFGNRDIGMMELNPNTGAIININLYGTSNFESANHWCVKNGVYVRAGYYDDPSNGYDILLAAMDDSGNILWAKHYGGSGFDRAVSASANDLGYIIYAYSTSFGSGTEDLLVIQTDQTGEVIWSKKVGGANLDLLPNWGDVGVTTSDGGAAFLATSNSYSATDDLLLVKLNECGDFACSDSSLNIQGIDLLLPSSPVSLGTLPLPNWLNTNAATTAYNPNIDSVVCTNNPCNVTTNFSYTLVCEGDSTLFTDLSFDNDTNNVVNWFWDFGDGDTLIGVQNPSHLYDTAGVYQVCLTVTTDGVPACVETVCMPVEVVDSLVILGPSDTTICFRDSVLLLPEALLCGDTTLLVSWSPGYGLSDSTVLSPTAAPDSTTTYTVTVTDSSGVISTDSVTITVLQNCCVSHAALAASDSLVCTYDTILFSNLSIDTTNALYFWNFGIGANPSFFVGANPPPVYYTEPGGYEVSLVLQDDCGIDTAFLTIYVAEIPESDPGDTLLCGPGTTLIGNPPVAYWHYQWFPADDLNDSTLAQPTAQVDSSTTYYVIITDSVTGCTRLDSVRVDIGALNITLGPDVTICPGDSATLNAPGVFCGTPPYVYSWSPPGTLSDPSIPNPVASPPATTTYTLTVTDATGATADTTITVTVLPACCQTNALISFQAGDYCIGDTLTFINQSLPDGPPTYTWNFGPNATPSTFVGENPPPVVYNSSGTFTVSLIISDACTTDTAFQTVTILPPPAVDAGANFHVCLADSVQLSATAAPNTAVNWEPDGIIGATNSLNPNAYINQAQTLTIFVEDTLTGCTNSDMVSVTFGSQDVNLGLNPVLCEDSTLLLNATNIAGSSYLWQDGSTSPTYTVTSAGIYHVTVTNQCGVYTDTVTVVAQDCNCYFTIPNVFSPNGDGYNDGFRVVQTGDLCDLRQLAIYNRWGKIVWQSNDPDPIWYGSTVNGGAAAEGTYYYVIELGDEVYTGHVTLLR